MRSSLAHGGMFFASWLVTHRDGMFSSFAVLASFLLLLCLIVRTYTSEVERFVSRSAAYLSADGDRSVDLGTTRDVSSTGMTSFRRHMLQE